MSEPNAMLATNVMHFARLLRRAGLPVGPAELWRQPQLCCISISGSAVSFRQLCGQSWLHRHEHNELFDQAFSLFWRNPDASRFAAALAAMEGMRAPNEERAPPGSRRIAEAMAATKARPPREEPPEQNFDASLTFSERGETTDDGF